MLSWLSVGYHSVISDDQQENRLWWVAGGSSHTETSVQSLLLHSLSSLTHSLSCPSLSLPLLVLFFFLFVFLIFLIFSFPFLLFFPSLQSSEQTPKLQKNRRTVPM